SIRIGSFCSPASKKKPISQCRNFRLNSLRQPARKLILPQSRAGLSATVTASKKTLLASEHDRPDIKAAREEWTTARQPHMRLEPQRLVFLDETGTTTKMTRLRGRCPKGQRLRSKAPFGHWMTETFVAGLRCDRLTAPFVVNAPMDRRIFEAYVEKELAPTLAKGDIVIMDNLPPARPPRRLSRQGAPGSGSCRPIVPTSIRSRWRSQSLKLTCAQEPPGPSMPSGRRSGASAISSILQNAKTTSPPLDMDSVEHPALKFIHLARSQAGGHGLEGAKSRRRPWVSSFRRQSPWRSKRPASHRAL